MQIEVHKEEMKRLDAKTEKALKELDRDRTNLRVSVQRLEENINDKMLKVELDSQRIKENQNQIERENKQIDMKIDKVVPLRTLNLTCDLLH